MIAGIIENTETAGALIQSVFLLADKLDKDIAIVLTAANAISPETQNNIRESAPKAISERLRFYSLNSFNEITAFCENNEASFLFIQTVENKRKAIQQALKACRELRIPYIIYKNNFDVLATNNVLVPVSFLEEEVEKAQFASAFGRFCNAGIYLLQAKDYGTKAAKNVERMKDLFDKFELRVNILIAKSDSFKVNKESASRAVETDAGIILITASREYGLDDILFGPQELHLIQQSAIPVLLVNPRSDLYALCD